MTIHVEAVAFNPANLTDAIVWGDSWCSLISGRLNLLDGRSFSNRGCFRKVSLAMKFQYTKLKFDEM